MTETLTARRSLPLTDLGEDERMFRDAVRDFAEDRVRPLVHQMDHDAVMSKDLISSFFDLGNAGKPVGWPGPDDGYRACDAAGLLEMLRLQVEAAVGVDPRTRGSGLGRALYAPMMRLNRKR